MVSLFTGILFRNSDMYGWGWDSISNRIDRGPILLGIGPMVLVLFVVLTKSVKAGVERIEEGSLGVDAVCLVIFCSATVISKDEIWIAFQFE